MKFLAVILVAVTGLVAAGFIAVGCIYNKPTPPLEMVTPEPAKVVAPGPCVPVNNQGPPRQGEAEISICFQERVAIAKDGLLLHFVGYQDDRCPSDAVCATAGEAYVFLSFEGFEETPTILKLPWDGTARIWNDSIRVGNHEFELRDLVPAPSLDNPVAPSRYRAVVAVRTITSASAVQ